MASSSVLTFGKYRGRDIESVMKEDIGYIDYLLDSDDWVSKNEDLVAEIAERKKEDAGRVEQGEETRFHRKKILIIPFGKYKGKHISEIVKKDPSYCSWLIQADIAKVFTMADIVDYINAYIGTKEKAEQIRSSLL